MHPRSHHIPRVPRPLIARPAMHTDGIEAPIAHFESFADGRGWNASFREPSRHRAVYTLDEVIPLLRDAEKAARSGLWVALALSYDAAPAFDFALKVEPSSGFPLAWMAVFEKPSPPEFNSACDRPFLLSEWEPQIERPQYRQAIRSIEAALKVDEVNDVILQVAANRSETKAVRETPAQSR